MKPVLRRSWHALGGPVCFQLALCLSSSAQAQTAAPAKPPAASAPQQASPANNPVGDWYTIHDETHRATSVVRIAWEGETLVGRVLQVLASTRGPNPLCDKCSGERHDKPVIGMDILWGLRGKDGAYDGGYVLDPSKGKEYRARIRMRGANTLELRGYLGIAAFGRTQVWQRVPPGGLAGEGA